MFRDYNPEKDKRFNSTTVLSYKVRSNMKICLIGTMKHIEEAKNCKIDSVTIDDLKKFNGE